MSVLNVWVCLYNAGAYSFIQACILISHRMKVLNILLMGRKQVKIK